MESDLHDSVLQMNLINGCKIEINGEQVYGPLCTRITCTEERENDRYNLNASPEAAGGGGI